MFIEFVPAAGALVEVKLKDGTVIDQDKLDTIKVDPYFIASTSKAEIFHLTVNDQRDTEQTLKVSGQSGTLRLTSKKSVVLKRAVPKYDKGKR